MQAKQTSTRSKANNAPFWDCCARKVLKESLITQSFKVVIFILLNVYGVKIKDLDLATVNKENRCVRHWLQCFKSLSCIPFSAVKFTFNLLVSRKSQSEQDDRFDLCLKYFPSTWYNFFPPRFWNYHEIIGILRKIWQSPNICFSQSLS